MLRHHAISAGVTAGSWIRAVALLLVLVVSATAAALTAAGPKFYSDDPLTRDPESQDASGANPYDVNLIYSLSYNLFVTGRKPVSLVRAGNLNTIDEVPDSGWFTNRFGSRMPGVDEAVGGPAVGPPPAADRWTIIRQKTAGDAPGFTARDAKGETFFVSFDPPSNPEAATAAIVIATKIFWTLGYNQVESFVSTLRPEQVDIAPGAQVKRPSGERTAMTRDDLSEVLERSARSADGSYRIAAGRLVQGKVLGPFEYHGTRSDDPNDLVPHEHRRELRALRIFGAWTNLTDMKAGNTLDTLLTENGRGVVRHYLQDVGSTFGIGANGPHDWNEGWEYVWDKDASRRRLFTFGFALSPWQTADYQENVAIGRFEGSAFDPLAWKPRVPTKAFVNMRADDAFWAARRVVAFSDEMIRAIVATGKYSDPAAAQLLGDVLIRRRDRIGAICLTAVNPIVDPTLDGEGLLRFGNAAVDHRFAEPPASYKAAWFTFDNHTQESKAIGDSTAQTPALKSPRPLPDAPGTFIRVELSAMSAAYPSWARPIQTYFVRRAGGWSLVGLERMGD